MRRRRRNGDWRAHKKGAIWSKGGSFQSTVYPHNFEEDQRAQASRESGGVFWEER